jgi:hypothetical protein
MGGAEARTPRYAHGTDWADLFRSLDHVSLCFCGTSTFYIRLDAQQRFRGPQP